MKGWLHKVAVTALVSGALLAVGYVPAQAENCEQRVRKAEERMHQAEKKHGGNSKQAQDRRRDLEREKAACRHDDRHDHGR